MMSAITTCTGDSPVLQQGQGAPAKILALGCLDCQIFRRVLNDPAEVSRQAVSSCGKPLPVLHISTHY